MEGSESKLPTQHEDLIESEMSSYSGSERSTSSANKPPAPSVDEDALEEKETKDATSRSSMASVNKSEVPPDDALQVKETKDSGSDSSFSSVNKPAEAPVNDDALKVEETQDSGPEPKVLLEKISSLEEEVVSLKQKLQSLTDENNELKLGIEEDLTDVSLYMFETKLEMDAKEEEVEATEEIATKLDDLASSVSKQKKANQSKHVSKIKEIKMKMKKYTTEISQLKSTHQKKEKTVNGVIGHLQNNVAVKCKLIDELNKKDNSKDAQLAILWDEKSSRDILIQRLKNELNSVKSESVVLPSFDNIQILRDELKLKLMALESEVNKQTEAMSKKK
ncbi:hypothetical protein QVD17_35778 [Tagetes erecta]|uniref:Uncharacterized protein n=1 Tax=Tagetes erecta TaxID=13708 RepID=A0AAD8JRE6_TARER|nr:hypothetical protein QVD17_35778 [Tagetes erecta]